jgi:UDP-N-acetylglucosamine 2-epimerase (non-hydrolysing)
VRIVYVVGARPNIVKLAPVRAALARRLPSARHVLVHTGQHYDWLMSDVFLEELSMGRPDYELAVGPGSHSEQTSRTMARLEPVLRRENPALVIVAGDVNATLATAIVAAQLGFPVAHVEAGLRSFDRTMPEELNRVLCDHVSELLFVHCSDAVENLRREGVDASGISLVGNTMIDSLVAMEPRFRAAGRAAALGLRPREYLLVTLHRPALVDGPRLGEVMTALKAVSAKLPVVFPVHPRTRRALTGTTAGHGLRLLEPLGYIDFLSLQADAAAVLTDSGGVQEETTYLRVPCFTLRDNTERPITVTEGTNTLLGLAPGRIASIPEMLASAGPMPAEPPPLWDGRAAERIAEVVAGLPIE